MRISTDIGGLAVAVAKLELNLCETADELARAGRTIDSLVAVLKRALVYGDGWEHDARELLAGICELDNLALLPEDEQAEYINLRD